MIGNDIIDLKVAAEQSDPLRRGYFNKIYSYNEQEIIIFSENPVLQHWLLWAMKESAYKANQRRFNLPRSLDPKQMECSILSQEETSALGTVEIQGIIYSAYVSITEAYIFCIASILQQKEISSNVYPESENIKTRFLKEISSTLKFPIQSLGIQKNEHEIPYLKYKNETLKNSFSLTHHGKFSAFSMALMNY